MAERAVKKVARTKAAGRKAARNETAAKRPIAADQRRNVSNFVEELDR